MKEAASTFETSINIYQTTWRNKAEDSRHLSWFTGQINGRKTDKICSTDCPNRQDLRNDVTLCSTAGGKFEVV
jgi:hypothetical protein